MGFHYHGFVTLLYTTLDPFGRALNLLPFLIGIQVPVKVHKTIVRNKSAIGNPFPCSNLNHSVIINTSWSI